MTGRGRAPWSAGDEGSAVVEFLGVTLVLLVPVVYLVLVLAQIQAAAFAVDGAAREAARAFVTSEVDPADRAVAAVALAFEDQGLDPTDAPDALSLTCSDPGCSTPGSTVTAEVALDVTLIGVPSFVADVVPLAVPVSSVAIVPVERFVAGSAP